MGEVVGRGRCGQPVRDRSRGGRLRSDEEHAGQESGEQAADVGGEVCRSADGAVDDVVEDEDSRRLGNAVGRGWIERTTSDEQKTEDGAVKAEDGARGSCTDCHGMDPNADDAACEACDEVDEQVADASEDGFDERPDQVEHVHVHADVDDAEVQKAGGEETPVLVSADGRRAEVAAPIEDVEGRGLGEGDAACHHGQEDQDVDGDQRDRDGVWIARSGDRGLPGERFGEGGAVHVSTVLALCWGGRGQCTELAGR
jgi:hypothetical protein